MQRHASKTEVRFGDLYSVPSRNGVSKPKRVRGSGYPMVNMGEIFKYSRIGDLASMELAPLTDKELENSLLEHGDLLFARQSLVAEGAGKCSIFLGFNKKTTFESHLIRVRLNKNVANSDYYFYYFSSPKGKGKVQSLVMQVAAAGIRASELENLIVDLLPIESQKAIANALSAYDNLIENNNRRIKILEETAQKIYTEWFVNLRFLENGDSINTKGSLPEGWKMSELSKIVEIRKEGVSPLSVADEFPYIGIEHLPRKNWGFDSYSTASTARSNKLKFYKDDILFGNIRPYFHKVLLSPIDGICSTDIVVLKPRKIEYLMLAFAIVYSQQFIAQATTTSKGTKMPRGDWSALINFPVIIPPDHILKSFNLITRDLQKMAQNLNFQNQKLAASRNLLLPKIIMGGINI